MPVPHGLNEGLRVIKVVCGGMHSVVLTSNGRVFSWGCNDDGALGRPEAENAPHEVVIGSEQGLPMTDITAGDSHSIAYNTQLNHIYLWGLYRVCLIPKNSVELQGWKDLPTSEATHENRRESIYQENKYLHQKS